MSLADFDAEFDIVTPILTSQWIGAAGDPIVSAIPIVPDAGPNAENTLELFGNDGWNTSGNYTEWSLVVGSINGPPLAGYSRLVTPRLGSVDVPVVTAPAKWSGSLWVRAESGTVKPAITFSFRVKLRRAPIASFRAERLARFQPRETAIDRLLSGVGRIFRGG